MEGDPPPEEDFSQIPLVERSAHKNWKARLSAYNDVIAAAGKTASDTDPFFRPFLSDPSLKKWCLDANAIAQEKGVEAVMAIVTNSGESSARLRPEIVPSIVDKALGNTRAATKKKGTDLCAMFVEVENGGEGVVTDVLVGLSAKTPKAVAGAVACLKELVEAFGVTALGNIKPLLKALPKVFAHSDKNVRAEGTGLTLALYTYLGPALLPALADLKPVQLTELQKQFGELDADGKGAGSGKPQRYTRKAQREREEAGGGDDDGEGGAVEEEAPAIDPLSLLDPVDVLALFPSDAIERLGSVKWKERLEACEECNKVLSDPKNSRISDANVGAYSSLVNLLGTKCQKDANVNVVMEAAKLLEGLARGIGKPFGQYKAATVPPMMERLKERKAAVVEALGKALDAIFLTTTLSEVTESILTALKSKNPQVKEGSLNFLHRSLKVTQHAPANDDVKPMAEALVALLSDSAEPVRTAAAECLGTMMKILGERAFNPYVENVPELQLAKVKEAFAKAEIKYRAGGKGGAKPRAGAPAAAARPAPIRKAAPPSPAKKAAAFGEDELLQDIAPPARKPPARLLARQQAARSAENSTPSSPTSSSPAPSSPTRNGPPARSAPTPRARPTAKPTAPTPAAGPSKPAAPPKAGGSAGPSKTLASSPTDPVKYRFTPEDAAAQAADVIPADYHTKLADAAWKVRLEAAEELVAWVGEGGGAEAVDSEVMMRFLGKTPGWGEKNFQVSAKLYHVMALMGEKSPSFGKPAAALIIAPLTDKLGDMKLKKPAGDALVVCAEKTSLAFVLAQSYDSMSKQKAPKALADALTWIKQQVIDFGIAGVTLRELITFIKGALGSPNALVRSSATALLVQVKIAVGADISGFIEDLNPQLLTTINKEFDKVADQSAPEPTREQADLRAGPAAGGAKGKGGADPLDDLIPRVDLDKLVNQTTILTDSKSDAWKVRKEAFDALNALLEIKSNQRLKPNMGEVGTVLKKAMADTNISVKMLALGLISKIAIGMGQPFEKYCRLLVAPVASVCADQKAGTRTAGVNTLTAISEAVGGLGPMYNGLAASLETTNPALRASVLAWMAEKLQADPPPASSDLGPLAAPLISCLEDRNGDVRKGAGAVLPFVVANAGYDHVMDQTSNLKPASRSTIIPLIEKARAAAPSAAEPEPRPAARAAPGPALAAARTTKAPVKAAPTPSRPTAGLAKLSLAAPGRSIAMKSLGSAPGTRPGSGLSDGMGGGFGLKSRLAAPRSASASTAASQYAAEDDPAGRTIPFVTSAPDARILRLKRDVARWNLDAAARNDMLEYLQPQMEPHASSDIFTLLFSKDHRAEEDFMAALAVIAEFYDEETAQTFGLSEDELRSIQMANVDLALKYAALRLLANNTQLGARCLEVISNVLGMLERSGERLSDAEVKLFVPALIIKLGDAKFGPRLAAIFDGLDKLIPASQVVQLLVQYGLEDKSVGKTGRNESLQLIEKAYRKRGSVLRKDDRSFYEAVAKCIADQGTRQNALTLMALLQIQGESRNLQAVIDAMPASAKDMLANRRATLAANKTGGTASRAVSGESGPGSPRAGSPAPRPRVAATPSGASRLSRDTASGSSSPVPQPRGIPAPSSSRLPTGATPSRSIPSASGLPRPGAAGVKRNSQPDPNNAFGAASSKPSMQPLGRPGQSVGMSEAAEAVAAMKTRDVEDSAEALKLAAGLLEEDEQSFVAEARQLLDALCFQLEMLSARAEDLLEPRNLRRVKHLMRTIHLAFSRANIVKRLKLEGLERLYGGIRKHYAMLEVWTETGGEDNQPASDLRDYMSMVLSSLIATPAREVVYTMLFDALVDLCKDPGQNPNDPHVASEIGVVLQCTYKRVRSIDNDLRSNRIQAGALLSIIEELLQVIPPVQWRRRPKHGLPHGDLPLRVIKTLLQRVIVYTKEINVGIYDLLQEQFGADADTTTVYSYIFRISSADDASATSAPATAAQAAPQHPQQQHQQQQMEVPLTNSRRRSNGHERPLSTASASTQRSSMGPPDHPLPTPQSRSPTRELSDAERLVRRLTDPRDSEQRLNELYAFMKSSPENEAEARAAISSILTSAAQTFVWRAIDRRTGDDEPKSPPPQSPLRSPVRDIQSPPLGAPLRRPSLHQRPSSMIDRSQPVDDQLAQLKAVFGRATSRTSGGTPSRGSPSGRPMSEISSPSGERPSLAATQRPMSEIQRRSGSPELGLGV